MPFFKTILFAADFSKCSQEAFRVLASLARANEARVLVVHVVEAVQLADGPVYFNQQPVRFVTVERDRAYHDSIKERLRRFYVSDRTIQTEYQTRDGLPTDEILRAAEEAGCDLIVLGTHGRTGLSRILAGSVAEAVLRGARCPVLALHSSDHKTLPERRIQTILVPTDDLDHAQSALGMARSLARDLGARLILLHVVPREVIVVGDIPVPVDISACRESLEILRKELAGPDFQSPIEVVLGEGDAASEILSTADKMACDLIVMGTHGRTGLVRLLMGSVAEAVLRRADCPVLMVKPSATITDSVSPAELSGHANLKSDPVAVSHRPGPAANLPLDQDASPERGGNHATARAVTAEQLREASESLNAQGALPSNRDRMVMMGRGNQQAGRQGS